MKNAYGDVEAEDMVGGVDELTRNMLSEVRLQ